MTQSEIGMIHALARSGATIICKQIAAMNAIALYSEIHPNGPELALNYVAPPANGVFNIRVQGGMWFNLYTAEEAPAILEAAGAPNSVESLVDVIERTLASSRHPVLRDWAQLDYLPPTGSASKSSTLSLLDTLQENYRINQAAIIRHPLANYISFIRMKTTSQNYHNRQGFNDYLEAYRAFTKAIPDDRVVRYEDYRRDPHKTIRSLCSYLNIPFDPDFAAKALNYTKITGDSAAKGKEAYSDKAKTVDHKIQDFTVNNALYDEIIEEQQYDRNLAPPGYVFDDK